MLPLKRPPLEWSLAEAVKEISIGLEVAWAVKETVIGLEFVWGH